MRRYPFLLTIAALSTAGCNQVKSAAQSVENKLFAEPEYKPVEGEDATAALQPVTGAAPFDPAALSQAMDVAAVESSKETLKLLGLSLTADSEEIPEVSGATVDFLNAGAPAKNALKSEGFKQPNLSKLNKTKLPGGALVGLDEIDGYNSEKDTVDLTDGAWGGKNEILSSVTGRVSVKNQQARGTCAAHAGIGHLEYLILKKYGNELSAIDLSEQRFYMLSLSELWDKGGGVTDVDSSSWWPQGFKMSFGDDGKKPPTATEPYNIPLEKACPYNPGPGANEIQIPQAATCNQGTVRVSNLTKVNYESKDGGNTWKLSPGAGPRTAQEIFNFIKTHDVPVPISSVLTQNWMDNDGMITYAKSQTPGHGLR